MFLPTTPAEIKKLGWDQLDIILVTGDCYIDSPYIGTTVIGKVLTAAGYRVGIIGQPDINDKKDITRLGEPKLFWGISGGSIDSMVANRTASGRRRRRDDYTPGGQNDKRPDRAVLIYSNLVRQHFKNTVPIVLGGIEASLRRIAHYDYWSDKIRRSVLIDAKADYLLYGMAERSVVELADTLRDKANPKALRGLCYIDHELPEKCIELPEFAVTAVDKDAFIEMFHLFYRHNDPITARPIAQKYDNRYVVQTPPPLHLRMAELDAVYAHDYERDVHPIHQKDGPVKALDTIRFSISTHRGCYGECNFCAIAVHEGQTIRWRSRKSILEEARKIAEHPGFKGTLHDVGGPTANMYGFECEKKLTKGNCPKKRCVFPDICSQMPVDHHEQNLLLEALRQIKGVKKIAVASGIRYDMVLKDHKNGLKYLRNLIRHHVSGQMKVAPEHSEDNVLAKMGKPGTKDLVEFRKLFYKITREEGKNQFLTYYMIAAHPGCEDKDMIQARAFAQNELGLQPEQVQLFTPTPSTYSTLMYWTEKDPFTGAPCFVEKSVQKREKQKDLLVSHKKQAKHRKKTGRPRQA